MSALADVVLPLIRTRADLSRWSAANAHGQQMHQAIDLLEAALPTTPAPEAHKVVQAALTSAVKVIARADDSSGIIGDACRRLLELHPTTAAAARVSPSKLVEWMITFQFNGDVDYFEIDPVAYAPALGPAGVATYRQRLDDMRLMVGPEPTEADRRMSQFRHEHFVLHWNDRRLAVLDRDVDAIIRTHARDRKVAAWLQDTAEGLEEIGEIDLAIDWARQATDHNSGHQSLKAGDYWCQLLARHRPHEALAARQEVFRRWPSSTTAARLQQAAGTSWPDLENDVLATLATRPRDAVLFLLLSVKDVRRAWEQANALGLQDDDVWAELAEAYERIDPLATLAVHQRLVEHELAQTGAPHYRRAAKRLVRMRKLATGTDRATEVDEFITRLRDLNRRRPRLQEEFDHARLP